VEERVFGRRYRVLEVIGIGGMADVYKAHDETLGRTVAVKVLHARYATDPNFVQRFRQEAASAANLSHPNIVNIYDWGQDGDDYYIAMEYVHGTDLKALVQQKGPIDPLKAADYGAQVAAALSVAHGYDIIHRDIKPQNIVLTPDGTIKVMDFGIARAGNSDMTQTGSVLGTAQYVSPEQAQGRPLTAASDLYSLGVVLYELTTGRPPFEGDAPVAIALKQVNEPPVPPRQLNPAIPPALEAIILTAMQKRPQDRLASAEEMRRELLSVAQGEGATAVVAGAAAGATTSVMPSVSTAPTAPRATRGAPPKKRSPWPWIALAAVLVLGALAVAYALGVFGPKGVPVPNVTGMTPSEAQTAITDAGLVVGDVEQQYSEEATPGVVMDQSPEPGVEAEKGSAVKLVVSKGKELLTVPDLKGKTESEASRIAREAGFALDVPERKPNKDVPKGVVFAQTPEPGAQLPRGTLIVLTVSEGVELKQVPDVLNKSKADADKAIKAAGLVPKFTEDFSDTVAPGKVISQTPDPGVFVNAGATVTGAISKGPATVTVPDVTDKSEADAKATLEGLGLKVTVNYQISPDVGFVLTQDPLPNAVVQKGSNVTIWVGKSSS